MCAHPRFCAGVAEGRDDARAAAERWARYRELGLPGLLAPEAAGGLGLTSVDLVLIAEEIGRAAVPEALIEHAAVAVPLLAEHSRRRACRAGARGGRGGSCARRGGSSAGVACRRCRPGRLAAPRRGRRASPRAAIGCPACRGTGERSSAAPASRFVRTGDGDPDRGGCRGAGGDGPRLRSRRAARGGAMSRPGGAHARDRRRLCQRAQAVRPGRSAPTRRSSTSSRVRRSGSSSRARSSTRAAASLADSGEKTRAAVSHAKLAADRGRGRLPREPPCRCTARWATPGRSICTST